MKTKEQLKTMRIDEYLNNKGIEVLQRLHTIWLPEQLMSGSKSELLRSLRSVMLDADTARHVHSHLSALPKLCLRTLLRSSEFALELGELAASLPGQLHVDDVEKSVITLANSGFVHVDDSNTGSVISKQRIVVPCDMAKNLIEKLHIERRSLLKLLSLKEQLDKTKSRTGELQSLCDSAMERISSLSTPALRKAVEIAIFKYGGIVPKHSLETLGLSCDSESLKHYRAKLEQARVGTVGMLTLWKLGIELDDVCLIIYQEIVDKQLSAMQPSDLDGLSSSSVGVDFLSDLRLLVDMVSDNRFRLKLNGELHRAAANRIVKKSFVQGSPFHTKDDLFALRLDLAEKLNLVEPGEDGFLHVGFHAREWTSKPVATQLSELTALWAQLRSQSSAGLAISSCPEIAVSLVEGLNKSQWYSAETIARRTICRLLLQLDNPLRPSEHATNAPPDSATRISLTLKQLHKHVAQEVFAGMHAIGVLETAVKRRSLKAIRLSNLGARALGKATTTSAVSDKALIVNPDFEVIVLPEGSVDELLYQLGRFCERGKSDQTYHLKITKRSVERAIASEMCATDIVNLLKTHSRAPVPQNVIYSVETWAHGVHIAAMSEVHIIETADADVLDMILELPDIKDVTVKRLAPTAAVLAERIADEKTILALRRLGVHLRDEIPEQR